MWALATDMLVTTRKTVPVKLGLGLDLAGSGLDLEPVALLTSLDHTSFNERVSNSLSTSSA